MSGNDGHPNMQALSPQALSPTQVGEALMQTPGAMQQAIPAFLQFMQAAHDTQSHNQAISQGIGYLGQLSRITEALPTLDRIAESLEKIAATLEERSEEQKNAPIDSPEVAHEEQGTTEEPNPSDPEPKPENLRTLKAQPELGSVEAPAPQVGPDEEQEEGQEAAQNPEGVEPSIDLSEYPAVVQKAVRGVLDLMEPGKFYTKKMILGALNLSTYQWKEARSVLNKLDHVGKGRRKGGWSYWFAGTVPEAKGETSAKAAKAKKNGRPGLDYKIKRMPDKLRVKIQGELRKIMEPGKTYRRADLIHELSPKSQWLRVIKGMVAEGIVTAGKDGHYSLVEAE
jgi:hypothetical protein